MLYILNFTLEFFGVQNMGTSPKFGFMLETHHKKVALTKGRQGEKDGMAGHITSDSR